jgi:hypothetical protein
MRVAPLDRALFFERCDYVNVRDTRCTLTRAFSAAAFTQKHNVHPANSLLEESVWTESCAKVRQSSQRECS